MKIVFTGLGGKAGSWHMRGVQMAATRPDWIAIPKATKADLVGADAVVLVKRAPKDTVAAIKAWGGPFLYEPLDFYDQPASPEITNPQHVERRFMDYFKWLLPDVVLTTNSAMASDLKMLCKKTVVLPHHYDPRIDGRCFRRKNKVLVYWGHPRYLGGWEAVATESCRALGLEFCVNPKDPSNCLLMFGVRGGKYGTWLDHRWKSCVKGSTAMILGVPFLAQPDVSYVEHCGSHLVEVGEPGGLFSSMKMALDVVEETKVSAQHSIGAVSTKLEAVLVENF